MKERMIIDNDKSFISLFSAVPRYYFPKKRMETFDTKQPRSPRFCIAILKKWKEARGTRLDKYQFYENFKIIIIRLEYQTKTS